MRLMIEHARRLLIVEDDPGLLKQLKWCFEGYDVYTAENRHDAITELRRHEPAVVLQDLGLPPRRALTISMRNRSTPTR